MYFVSSLMLFLFCFVSGGTVVPHVTTKSLFVELPELSREANSLIRLSREIEQDRVVSVAEEHRRAKEVVKLVDKFLTKANKREDSPLQKNQLLTFDFVFPLFSKLQLRGEYIGMFVNCPAVFSPVVYDEYAAVPFLGEGEVAGRSFIELGCGVGYNAIRAKRMGARLVEATDISTDAVECAKKNVAFANLEGQVLFRLLLNHLILFLHRSGCMSRIF